MLIIEKLKGAGKSVTIWFNTTLLAIIPFSDHIKEALPMVQDYLTPDMFRNIGLIIVVVNIALRFKTNKCLSEK